MATDKQILVVQELVRIEAAKQHAHVDLLQAFNVPYATQNTKAAIDNYINMLLKNYLLTGNLPNNSDAEWVGAIFKY